VKKQKRFNDYSFPDRSKGASELKEFTPPQTQPSKEVLQDKHTKGEWKVNPIPGYGREVRVMDSSGNKKVICLCNSSPSYNKGEAEANAELIVKAVNERQWLLDSLKLIQQRLRAFHDEAELSEQDKEIIFDIYLSAVKLTNQ
jgi:hypothetical protein